MKLRLIINSIFLCAGLLVCSSAAFSADLTLDATPISGCYFSDSTIYSADTSCVIQKERKVQCVSQVIYLKPGFSVKTGAYFAVSNGSTYADIPKNLDFDGDGLKDWWEYESFGDFATQDKWTDNDNDGFSDLIEFIAGTELDNPNSRPESGDYYQYDAEGRVSWVFRVQ